jgi:hypothetical protein
VRAAGQHAEAVRAGRRNVDEPLPGMAADGEQAVGTAKDQVISDD